nr:CASP-like protein 5A1 [Ipomoea batatas]
MSRSAVHPVEVPAEIAAPPRMRMKDIQGMPGTAGGLFLRLFQFAFSLISLCVMATTTDFPSVSAFCVTPIEKWEWRITGFYKNRLKFLVAAALDFEIGHSYLLFLNLRKLAYESYLVAAVSLQSLWSLLLAIADIYALLVKRSFRNTGLVSLFAIGDGITSTVTFTAACASAGITVLIGNDLDKCAVNHCKRFMSATAMAFLSWFTASPSFFLNFWIFDQSGIFTGNDAGRSTPLAFTADDFFAAARELGIADHLVVVSDEDTRSLLTPLLLLLLQTSDSSNSNCGPPEAGVISGTPKKRKLFLAAMEDVIEESG